MIEKNLNERILFKKNIYNQKKNISKQTYICCISQNLFSSSIILKLRLNLNILKLFQQTRNLHSKQLKKTSFQSEKQFSMRPKNSKIYSVLRNNFSVRLHNVSTSNVVCVKNVIPKIEFISRDAFADAAFDQVGHGVDPDGVVDPAAARGEHFVAEVAPGPAVVQHYQVRVQVWKDRCTRGQNLGIRNF